MERQKDRFREFRDDDTKVVISDVRRAVHMEDHVAIGILTLVAVSLISTVAILSEPALWHWFMVPTYVCGFLTGNHITAWILGRADIFSPRTMVGVAGFHFFYVVPILHVVLDTWPSHISGAHDWRASLGTVSSLTLCGLLLYYLVQLLPREPVRTPIVQIDERRLKTGVIVLGGASFAAWLLLVLQFGGPVGYWMSLATDAADLSGYGPLLLVAESWPMTFLVGIMALKREELKAKPWVVVFLLIVFAILVFATGGLRGSRANVVWPLLIAFALTHNLIFRIRRLYVVLLALAILAFAWLYSFYKMARLGVLSLFRGDVGLTGMVESTQRDLAGVLVGDLGRAGIQAILVDRLERGDQAFAYGATYLGDILKFIPFYDTSVPDKIQVGTVWLYGEGAYEHAGIESTRIYGLLGEGLLNFGYAAPLIVFVLFGIVARKMDAYYARAVVNESVPSIVIASTFASLAILLVLSDADNAFSFVIRRVAPIALIVYFATRRVSKVRLGAHAEGVGSR